MQSHMPRNLEGNYRPLLTYTTRARHGAAPWAPAFVCWQSSHKHTLIGVQYRARPTALRLRGAGPYFRTLIVRVPTKGLYEYCDVALRMCCLAAMLLPATAWAGGPAVTQPNGKISVEGGAYDDKSAGLALGSFSVPLGYAFGLQADGAIGTIDDETMGGGGLHLFTRDPSSYLFGAYGSYHTWDSIDIWRAAAEGELYFGPVSISGIAGYESVDVPSLRSGLIVLTPDDEHFFAHADLSYYLTEDFKISGGYRYLNESSFAAASAEYLLRGSDVPLSLFAKGDFGDDDYTRITGGVKVYLGDDPGKSLLSRHRTADPENYTPVFPAVRVAGPKSSASPTICSLEILPPETVCECPAGRVKAFCGDFLGHPPKSFQCQIPGELC